MKLSTKGGVSHHFGGVQTSLKKVSRDMGYRSDSIAVSRDMVPLRKVPEIRSASIFSTEGSFGGFP